MGDTLTKVLRLLRRLSDEEQDDVRVYLDSWPVQTAEEGTSPKARVLSRELKRSIPSLPFCCMMSASGIALLFVDDAVTAGSGGRTRRSRDEGPLPPSRTPH